MALRFVLGNSLCMAHTIPAARVQNLLGHVSLVEQDLQLSRLSFVFALYQSCFDVREIVREVPLIGNPGVTVTLSLINSCTVAAVGDGRGARVAAAKIR